MPPPLPVYRKCLSLGELWLRLKMTNNQFIEQQKMTLFLVLNCNCNYASSKFCTFCFIKRSFAKKEIPTNISILFPTRHHYFSCCTTLISGLIDPEISTTSRVERGQCFQIQDLFTCPRLARHLQLGIHS